MTTLHAETDIKDYGSFISSIGYSGFNGQPEQLQVPQTINGENITLHSLLIDSTTANAIKTKNKE